MPKDFSVSQADFMPKKINRLKWLGEKTRFWFADQEPLLEAFCVAASLHVLLFPVLWAAGWMLPWPKSPVSVTVIEIDLQKWLKEGKPGKIIHVRPPELNR
jgi:hypothetical protein